MSLQEYNSLKETEYLLSTKANQKRLEESIQQISDNDSVKLHSESMLNPGICVSKANSPMGLGFEPKTIYGGGVKVDRPLMKLNACYLWQ